MKSCRVLWSMQRLRQVWAEPAAAVSEPARSRRSRAVRAGVQLSRPAIRQSRIVGGLHPACPLVGFTPDATSRLPPRVTSAGYASRRIDPRFAAALRNEWLQLHIRQPEKVAHRPVVGQFEIICPLIGVGTIFDDLYLDRRMGMMRP